MWPCDDRLYGGWLEEGAADTLAEGDRQNEASDRIPRGDDESRGRSIPEVTPHRDRADRRDRAARTARTASDGRPDPARDRAPRRAAARRRRGAAHQLCPPVPPCWLHP